MKKVRIVIAVLGMAVLGPLVHAQQMITREDFFKDIVGFDEKFFREKDLNRKSYYFEKAPDGSFGILSGFNWNKRFDWAGKKLEEPARRGVGPHRRKAIFEGEFSAPTIATLKGQPSSIGQGNPGSFKVLLHDPYNPQKTDIRELQANPSNNGAAFQIASTFFGPLEGGMYKWESELTGMTRSPVQGEEASISAAPAAIYRKYFMALDPRQEQFRKNKFYLLYELANRLPMKLKPNGTPYVDAYQYRKRADDTDKVAVGIHYNIFVTSGFGGSGPNGQQVRLSTDNNPQRITQIFTSAYDTRFARGRGYANPLRPNVEQAAQVLLDGAYEGAIRAAASKGIKKLYLTLVGGGSFRNEIAWIGDAIKKIKDLIKDSGIEVILVYRPDKVRTDKVKVRTAEKDRAFLESLAEMAHDISGVGYDKKYMNGLIKQYVSPSYNKQKPLKQVIAGLQALFDQLAQVPQAAPRRTVAAATQVRRAVARPKPSAPPKEAVMPPVPMPQAPARPMPRAQTVQEPAEVPVSKVFPKERSRVKKEPAEVPVGDVLPQEEPVGPFAQAWQWVQSTRLAQGLSSFFDWLRSWF